MTRIEKLCGLMEGGERFLTYIYRTKEYKIRELKMKYWQV